MSFLIGILSAVLLLDALLLVLLVLIQLPKKEAGAGIAFGAGTADTLFGAGSGNALTRITKYALTVFLTLALTLTVIQSSRSKKAETGVGEALKKAGMVTPPPTTPAASTTPSVVSNVQSTATQSTNPTPAKAPASAPNP